MKERNLFLRYRQNFKQTVMRNLFSIFLITLLSAEICFSQDDSAFIFHINKLPTGGIILDTLWKFQAGDNPDFARSGYDDKKWQSFNPTLDIVDQPQFAKTGICWLRLKFSVDTSLRTQQLALIINQAVASEIFLNGRLLYRLGRIS